MHHHRRPCRRDLRLRRRPLTPGHRHSPLRPWKMRYVQVGVGREAGTHLVVHLHKTCTQKVIY